jgi:hypothetical protein
MGRTTTAFLLFILFSLACRPNNNPVLAPDQAASLTGANSSMQLEIQPATASSAGGSRMPVRFTIRNTGDDPVHACLSGGRVIHLWERSRDYGYTLVQQRAEQPSCEEPFTLAARGEYSWTEEITLPPAPGEARLVGLTQVGPAEPCTSGCEPVWLTASAPLKIEEQAASQGTTLDLRTGLMSTDLTTPIALNGPGGER